MRWWIILRSSSDAGQGGECHEQHLTGLLQQGEKTGGLPEREQLLVMVVHMLDVATHE